MLPALLPLSLIGFSRDIEPILSRNCYGCHGPAMQTSGLRLDRTADALKGGYSGPALVPGKSSESRLIEVVVAGKMPPGRMTVMRALARILFSFRDIRQRP